MRFEVSIALENFTEGVKHPFRCLYFSSQMTISMGAEDSEVK
jgi:hypothetical protein